MWWLRSAASDIAISGLPRFPASADLDLIRVRRYRQSISSSCGFMSTCEVWRPRARAVVRSGLPHYTQRGMPDKPTAVPASCAKPPHRTAVAASPPSSGS